ncbi:hypothetical protein ACQKWADRAFT_84981 [Trichoderma austrokoningii]
MEWKGECLECGESKCQVVQVVDTGKKQGMFLLLLARLRCCDALWRPHAIACAAGFSHPRQLIYRLLFARKWYDVALIRVGNSMRASIGVCVRPCATPYSLRSGSGAILDFMCWWCCIWMSVEDTACGVSPTSRRRPASYSIHSASSLLTYATRTKRRQQVCCFKARLADCVMPRLHWASRAPEGLDRRWIEITSATLAREMAALLRKPGIYTRIRNDCSSNRSIIRHVHVGMRCNCCVKTGSDSWLHEIWLQIPLQLRQRHSCFLFLSLSNPSSPLQQAWRIRELGETHTIVC